MKKKMNFTYIIWKEGKYYVSQCLNVDVSSFGKTRKDALKNLNEALGLYLEDVNSKEIVKIQSPSIVVRNFQYA